MIARRDFLRRVALIAAGAIAGDQLEILERLTHVRRLFPSADTRGGVLTEAMILAAVRRIYVDSGHFPTKARLSPHSLVDLSESMFLGKDWIYSAVGPGYRWHQDKLLEFELDRGVPRGKLILT